MPSTPNSRTVLHFLVGWWRAENLRHKRCRRDESHLWMLFLCPAALLSHLLPQQGKLLATRVVFWVLRLQLHSSARQMLLVTASGSCSSGWLWAHVAPKHRTAAQARQRCDISHLPLRCEPCTVQGAQAPLHPHCHHFSIPTTITPSPHLPSRTRCNHGQWSTWGWKPITFRGTVVTRGNHRVAQPEPNTRDYIKGCKGQQGAGLTPKDQSTGFHRWIPSSAQKPTPASTSTDFGIAALQGRRGSQQEGTCTSLLMLLPSKTFLWPRKVIGALQFGL